MADNSKAEFGKSPESLKRGKFKVLIIENDIDFIFIIKDQFKERKDIDITFSIAGEKALDILWKAKEMEEPFNLVVTDSSLVGELNGVEVAEAVKEKKLRTRLQKCPQSCRIRICYSPHSLPILKNWKRLPQDLL